MSTGASIPPPVLAASGIRFAYGDGRPTAPVLRDVSLTLPPRTLVALLGPNGSGKSTLIKVLLGHLRPDAGDVTWEGRDVRAWRPRELARRVAYLPQSPVFDPDQTVLDVLRLGRAPYWSAFGLESARDLEVVRRVADTLDLAPLLPRRIDQLSGGQRQRVFVGRCLVQEPRAMLLDEPSTFLDLRHQIELLHLLRDLATRQGLSILMASHDLNIAASFADRAVLLHDGAIVANAPPAEALDPARLRAVYGVGLRVIPDGQGGILIVPDVTSGART